MEDWSGSRWRLQRVPTPATFENLLFAVLAVSRDDVWATGQGENRRWPFGGLILEVTPAPEAKKEEAPAATTEAAPPEQAPATESTTGETPAGETAG